jgi:ABC-type transport system involved in multi-copper enzyme maturation permease subunit
MTKEKESQTMDLLLATPLTSKYILWGKLRGLVSFAAPLLMGPVAVLTVFGLFGLTKKGSPPAIWLEVALELGVLMVIYTAIACVIGLRISLVARKNVTAVMGSVGLMIMLCAIATALGLALVGNASGEFGAFLSPFTPFTSIWYLVDPIHLFESAKDMAAQSRGTRIAAFIGSAVAAAVYAFIVWSVYAGLVRNFDMIVRKQSGT